MAERKLPTYRALWTRIELLEQRVRSLEDGLASTVEQKPITGACPTMAEILDEVAISYGTHRLELMRRTNQPGVTVPRQCAMWLARHMTVLSLPQIGRILGRDHTTVLAGVRRHHERMQDDAVMRRTHSIRAAIRQQLDARRAASPPQPEGALNHG